MAGEISDQDLLVIERLGNYSHGQIVLAFVDGERLVRRFERRFLAQLRVVILQNRVGRDFSAEI
jgi:peptidase S24-like protein